MTRQNQNTNPQDVGNDLLHPLEFDQVVRHSPPAPSPTPQPVRDTPQVSLEQFRQYIEQQRPGLVQTIVHQAVENLNLYHPMPVSDVMRVIDTSMRIILEVLLDYDPRDLAPRVWGRLNIPDSYGLTLDQALQLMAISRYEFTRLSLPAIEQHIQGAAAGLLLLEQAHDAVVAHISRFYRQTLRKVNRALMALSHCNEALVDATDDTHLFHDVCKIIVEKGGYRMSWVAQIGPQRTVHPVAQAGHEYGYLSAIKHLWANPENDTPVHVAIRTGEPCIITDIATDPRTACCRDEALRRGYVSVISLPLISNRRTVGAVAIYSDEQEAFDTEEITLLSHLADNLAYGIGALRSRSRQKHAEKALKKSEQRFRTLIERNADPIVVLCNGIICFANPAAEHAFGMPASELIGYELGIPTLIDEKMELDVFDATGQHSIKEMHAVEIEWEDKKAYLATFRDVTAYKQMEHELEQRVRERTQRLLTELEERERTEQAILRHDVILESVQFAIERLLKTNHVQREIPVVLEHLGTATGVSRVAVFTIQPGEQAPSIQPQSEWVSPTIPTHNDDDDTGFHLGNACLHLPRWKERLGQGIPVYGDVQSLPDDERNVLLFYRIYSLLVLPVFVEQTWWGCIEFDDLQQERTWALADVETLKTAADLLGAALHRQQVETALWTCQDTLHTSQSVA